MRVLLVFACVSAYGQIIMGGGSNPAAPGGATGCIQLNAGSSTFGCTPGFTSTNTSTTAGLVLTGVNPAAVADANDHQILRASCAGNSTTTNPSFDDENCVEIVNTLLMGQAMNGGGTNAKKTSFPLNITGTYNASGQTFGLGGSVTKYGMSDTSMFTGDVTFAGGPVNGDEGQGFTVVQRLQQQQSLTRTAISAVTTTTCTTTLTQNVTKSITPQTVTVASSSGCPNPGWVTVGYAGPTASINYEGVLVTTATGTLTGVFVANHTSGDPVGGATLLTLAGTSKFGQDRVLVNLTQPTYTTGTVASISGGGFTGSGTTWTNGMVGGSAVNPGCIALTGDDDTTSPFGPGSAALKSWYEITAVSSNTALGIYSTSVAGNSAYSSAYGTTGGAYTISPCARVIYLLNSNGTLTNQVVLATNSFTWSVSDSVELALVPYPDVTGWQYQTTIGTAGGIRRAWYQVSNTGPTSYNIGFNVTTLSGTGIGWKTGYQATDTNTAFLSVRSNTSSAFVALPGSTITTPCYTFSTSGGTASGMCSDGSNVYMNANNAHQITLPSGGGIQLLLHATTGTNFLCVDASGNISKSASACSGT